jgi:hypothetical protein
MLITNLQLHRPKIRSKGLLDNGQKAQPLTNINKWLDETGLSNYIVGHFSINCIELFVSTPSMPKCSALEFF